jgi:hypothetical protein
MSSCDAPSKRKERRVLKQLGVDQTSLQVISSENVVEVEGVVSIEQVTLLSVDFTPVDSSNYNLNWPGPPRRMLKWSDVKIYKPIVKIEPIARDVTLYFWVREDRAGCDLDLGMFYVTIKAGNTEPNDSDIIGPSASGSGKAPIGAPNNAIGGFYLGATKKGKVKGSEDKNGRESEIYVMLFKGYPSWIYGIENPPESPRHTVRAN